MAKHAPRFLKIVEDARSRIKEALVFLTAGCATEVDPALRDWKPTERDSSTALETKIRDWNTYWTVTCPPGMKPQP